MLDLEMFSDHGMFMSCAWMEVTASVPNIICIAQMTCEFICCTLLVYQERHYFCADRMADSMNGNPQRKVTNLKSKFLYFFG